MKSITSFRSLLESKQFIEAFYENPEYEEDKQIVKKILRKRWDLEFPIYPTVQ